MSVTGFRIQNFMGFEDSGWLDLRPITLLFGHNSSGKSAILRALLLLRQSLQSSEASPLAFVRQGGQNYGSFLDMVRDHNPKNQISFWFWCDFGSLPNEIPDDLSRIELPGLIEDLGRSFRLRLIYRLEATHQQVQLAGLDLYHQDNRLILRGDAPAERTGTWQLNTTCGIFAGNLDGDIRDFWPRIKLVCANSFLPELYTDISRDARPKSYTELDKLLCLLGDGISDFLGSLGHLGPIRPAPQRYYYLGDRHLDGLSNDNAFSHFLYAHEIQELGAGTTAFSEVNQWLHNSGLHIQIALQVISAQDQLYRLVVTNKLGEPHFSVNLTDTGFGISQLLPLVIELLLAPTGSFVMVEQPELHLHPHAQAALSDLLIRATQRGIRVLVETHSEHLLLRLRRRVAESALARLGGANNGTPALHWRRRLKQDGWVDYDQRQVLPHRQTLYPPEDGVSLYYVRTKRGRVISHIRLRDISQQRPYIFKRPRYALSEILPLPLQQSGEMKDLPDSFHDFFADDLTEIIKLNEAISQLKAQG